MIEKLRSERHGEFDAAAAIWTRYFTDLLHLARRNLSPGHRQREDEDELLQSLYKSLCIRQRDGQYELEDRGFYGENGLAGFNRYKLASLESMFSIERYFTKTPARRFPGGLA